MRRPPPKYQSLHAAPSVEELCAEGALSLKRAAEFIGVSVRRMKTLISRGEVPSYLDGSRRMVPRVALVRRMAALMEKTAPGRERLPAGRHT